jgi:tRNA (guanosine-2'-O-)-methyltransferase
MNQFSFFCITNVKFMTPERYNKLTSVADRRQPDLTVVLENVFDPHNISAVMRTCDSVGIQDVYVLNTRIPRHEKWGRRSSSSSAKWVTVHQYENFGECLQLLRQRYQRLLTACIAPGTADMYTLDFTQSTALVFGNEHNGCSAEMIAAADGSFMIPQMGIIESLNISVACAVTVYEALRQRRAAGMYDTRSLNDKEYFALLDSWSVDETVRQQHNHR